jgi:hypothetical protein
MNNRDAQLSVPIVQWEFERDRRHVMCAIHAAVTSGYEVATVPLWDVGRTILETFNSASAALHRHAAIAADLRDAGWTVTAYTA